eukprot:15461615-Alexandrium_andersonii.AAC.1
MSVLDERRVAEVPGPRPPSHEQVPQKQERDGRQAQGGAEGCDWRPIPERHPELHVAVRARGLGLVRARGSDG